MPISDKQYEDIKTFINERLPYEMTALSFAEQFNLNSPYFIELKQKLAKDNNPFYVKCTCVGSSDGDAVGDIWFYKKE